MSGKIWDITQRLRPGLPVWPGDTEFSHKPTWQMDEGSPVNVSAVTMSTHSGTHADAPLHYDQAGKDSAASSLEPYIGECLVVDARGVGAEINIGDLPHLGSADRVLFRTYEAFPHDKWEEGFTAISAETIKWLAVQGVKLVGIDTPSLDPQNSKTMDAHKAVLAADMRILEGLLLDDVPAGRYQLIALPLPIEGADASPVRAILRELV